MDVVDISPAEAVPVDYKRGHVPAVPGGAWEPERVQVCVQGLILRENGYHCEAGILYYVQSRRRVTIPLDDELVERTRELARQMRQMAAEGTMPPPLDDSPKCPRCSLVGICLPDETSLLTSRADRAGKPEVRRLMPARDDAQPVYLQEQGTTLGKSGDQLVVNQLPADPGGPIEVVGTDGAGRAGAVSESLYEVSGECLVLRAWCFVLGAGCLVLRAWCFVLGAGCQKGEAVMRSVYLVCYDVADDKRLRQTHRKMCGFGDPVQYSVFRCELSPTEKQLLRESLWDILNWDQDRVMVVDLGPAGSRGDECIEFWGEPRTPQRERVATIV